MYVVRYSLLKGIHAPEHMARSVERMAERVGFEPTARCRVTGFQDQLLKPLGHLSVNILPVLLRKVKQANGGVRGI